MITKLSMSISNNMASNDRQLLLTHLSRTLVTIARSINHGAGLPKQMWPEVMAAANYLRNLNVTSTTGISPFEGFYGYPPILTHLRKFGCTAFALIPKVCRASKLDPTTRKGVFVGYDSQVKGYRIWLPQEHRIIISRDVEFRETGRPIGKTAAEALTSPGVVLRQSWDDEITNSRNQVEISENSHDSDQPDINKREDSGD